MTAKEDFDPLLGGVNREAATRASFSPISAKCVGEAAVQSVEMPVGLHVRREAHKNLRGLGPHGTLAEAMR